MNNFYYHPCSDILRKYTACLDRHKDFEMRTRLCKFEINEYNMCLIGDGKYAARIKEYNNAFRDVSK